MQKRCQKADIKVFKRKKVLKKIQILHTFATFSLCFHYVSDYETQKHAQKLQKLHTLLLFLLFLERYLKSAVFF